LKERRFSGYERPTAGGIMGSKKSRKLNKSFKAPKSQRRKFSLVLKIFIGAAIVVAWDLLSDFSPE